MNGVQAELWQRIGNQMLKTWKQQLFAATLSSTEPTMNVHSATGNAYCLLGLSQSFSICSRVRPLVSGTSFHMNRAASKLITP